MKSSLKLLILSIFFLNMAMCEAIERYNKSNRLKTHGVDFEDFFNTLDSKSYVIQLKHTEAVQNSLYWKNQDYFRQELNTLIEEFDVRGSLDLTYKYCRGTYPRLNKIIDGERDKEINQIDCDVSGNLFDQQYISSGSVIISSVKDINIFQDEELNIQFSNLESKYYLRIVIYELVKYIDALKISRIPDLTEINNEKSMKNNDLIIAKELSGCFYISKLEDDDSSSKKEDDDSSSKLGGDDSSSKLGGDDSSSKLEDDDSSKNNIDPTNNYECLCSGIIKPGQEWNNKKISLKVITALHCFDDIDGKTPIAFRLFNSQIQDHYHVFQMNLQQDPKMPIHFLKKNKAKEQSVVDDYLEVLIEVKNLNNISPNLLQEGVTDCKDTNKIENYIKSYKIKDNSEIICRRIINLHKYAKEDVGDGIKQNLFLIGAINKHNYASPLILTDLNIFEFRKQNKRLTTEEGSNYCLMTKHNQVFQCIIDRFDKEDERNRKDYSKDLHQYLKKKVKRTDYDECIAIGKPIELSKRDKKKATVVSDKYFEKIQREIKRNKNVKGQAYQMASIHGMSGGAVLSCIVQDDKIICNLIGSHYGISSNDRYNSVQCANLKFDKEFELEA